MGLFDSIGSIAGAAGGILGALGAGGKKNNQAPSENGVNALPSYMQDAIQNTLVPGALQAYHNLQPNYARVQPPKPGDIFADPQLYAMQQAADMRAGLAPQQDIYASGSGQVANSPVSYAAASRAGMPTGQGQPSPAVNAPLAQSFYQQVQANPSAAQVPLARLGFTDPQSFLSYYGKNPSALAQLEPILQSGANIGSGAMA